MRKRNVASVDRLRDSDKALYLVIVDYIVKDEDVPSFAQLTVDYGKAVGKTLQRNSGTASVIMRRLLEAGFIVRESGNKKRSNIFLKPIPEPYKDFFSKEELLKVELALEVQNEVLFPKRQAAYPVQSWVLSADPSESPTNLSAVVAPIPVGFVPRLPAREATSGPAQVPTSELASARAFSVIDPEISTFTRSLAGQTPMRPLSEQEVSKAQSSEKLLSQQEPPKKRTRYSNQPNTQLAQSSSPQKAQRVKKIKPVSDSHFAYIEELRMTATRYPNSKKEKRSYVEANFEMALNCFEDWGYLQKMEPGVVFPMRPAMTQQDLVSGLGWLDDAAKFGYPKVRSYLKRLIKHIIPMRDPAFTRENLINLLERLEFKNLQRVMKTRYPNQDIFSLDGDSSSVTESSDSTAELHTLQCS